MPYIIVAGILKNMLQEYSFYPDMVAVAILCNIINVFGNPLYAFIKIPNVRQGLIDLFKCRPARHQHSNNTEMFQCSTVSNAQATNFR